MYLAQTEPFQPTPIYHALCDLPLIAVEVIFRLLPDGANRGPLEISHCFLNLDSITIRLDLVPVSFLLHIASRVPLVGMPNFDLSCCFNLLVVVTAVTTIKTAVKLCHDS